MASSATNATLVVNNLQELRSPQQPFCGKNTPKENKPTPNYQHDTNALCVQSSARLMHIK
jgi:hypothetical protein